MPESMGARLKHAWNAFMNRDPTVLESSYGSGYSIRPDRVRLKVGNERTIITSINTRIAIDVASTTIQHVRLDENGQYLEVIKSGLNECLNARANVDQTGRAFLQDLVLTMIDEGCAAAVPVDTSVNPRISDSYDIKTLRVGSIIQWYPEEVRVKLYNDRVGHREEITLPKKMVAIIENPFYMIMNEPNSTLRRLTHKLSLLDITDEQTASGKLDMIIQLPYLVKGETRKRQANERRMELEQQLVNSKYGIGYIDGTEKVTQLNRSLENNLLKQVEYLTSTLYSQLGLTENILNGTANENELTNYNNRTIEPIVSAIVNEFNTKFLTKTARSQNQTIFFYRDPFKLIPVTQLAEMADKFTRNAIMTSNEFRQVIGMKAADETIANQLSNKNMPVQDEVPEEGGGETLTPEDVKEALG
jgi:hypothetical protein